MHAAKEYGVKALGVTLSAQQAAWAQNAIKRRGPGATSPRSGTWTTATCPRTASTRSPRSGSPSTSARKQLPAYFTFLRGKLRPGGRLLNHCITRPSTAQPAKAGKFIDRYVFPDGELEGVGDIVSAMQDNGLEVRHEENLREHYAMTLKGWCDNLEANWDDAVAEVGANRARVWLLYMAACRVGFDRRFIELHQVLGVRCDDVGTANFPLRPDFSAPLPR